MRRGSRRPKKDYRKLASREGKMNCTRCGKSVEDVAFCPYCGNSLTQQTMASSTIEGGSRSVMLLTSNYAPGYKVDKLLGLVYGITVRSRGMGGNIVAGLRTIAGGEIREYTELAGQARQQALDRLSEHAKSVGANAVLSVMFDSTEMAQSMEEIIAFGTAVTISPAVAGQLVRLS
jgi:uncharacterized protein YbjQ (UPF0145 family)